jgi:hypothetical protein
LFLYCLARALAPAAVLELGTCLGVSAAYLSAALEANGSGQLVTIDIEPEKGGDRGSPPNRGTAGFESNGWWRPGFTMPCRHF